MSGLQFRFADMISEVTALEGMAKPFLEPTSVRVLPPLRIILGNLQDVRRSGGVRWGISSSDPLITSVSQGAYQPDSAGAHAVFAEISFAWEIRRINPAGKKTERAEFFELIGLASTKVRLFRRETNGEKGPLEAMWRMEIGDVHSPGCHFHVQVMGETDERPFPKSIDVPRLPGILATPAAAVEFVLAELFQDEWAEHAAATSPHLSRWIPIQKRRLSAVLKWQSGVVQGSGGSPWTTLKRAKPDAKLFVE